MKMGKFFAVLVLLTFGFQGSAQCDDAKKNTKELAYNDVEMAQADIVDVAASLEDFSTLVTAVKAAGLVETLKSDGPFTVFAPTNKAFSKLPAGTLDGLLKPESKGTLSNILTYHVVSGRVMASDVVSAIKSNKGEFTIKTVSGGKLTASLDGDSVILTDESGGISTITKTDVGASNGIIHVIDTVVLPE
ncbi:fasciclin domain-containing protein [Sungkyunkwania multivorans]|uniref:Fasciclin domain-containing protein n=1 Tax=Sungkyunkwania multivorans TaxID=1173618 RepID=A0ABW3D0I2_9FLAO